MKILCIRLMIVSVALTVPGMVSAEKVPATGDRLVAIRLPTPETPGKRAYLGIAESDSLDPTTITGSLLVVEIFSMYCPFCNFEAPAINRLFGAIEASDTLRGRVKMIGIGVGNSAFEVDHFRKHYQIAFPLFPDEEFSIHQSLGEVRTPFFIIVDTGPNDTGWNLWTGAGNMGPLETFTNRLNGLLSMD